MKKCFLLLLFLSTVLLADYAIPAESYKVINVRSDDTLNVRRGAGTHNQKIGDLAYNAKNIQVIKCKNDPKGVKWCKVRYGSLTGWVSTEYLSYYAPLNNTASEDVQQAHREDLENAKKKVSDLEKEVSDLDKAIKENWQSMNAVVEEVNVNLPVSFSEFTLERFILTDDVVLQAYVTPDKEVFLNTRPGRGLLRVMLRKIFCTTDLSKLAIDADYFEYIITWKDKPETTKMTQSECNNY